jgi:subtilase family serine protease
MRVSVQQKASLLSTYENENTVSATFLALSQLLILLLALSSYVENSESELSTRMALETLINLVPRRS